MDPRVVPASMVSGSKQQKGQLEAIESRILQLSQTFTFFCSIPLVDFYIRFLTHQ